MSSKFIIPLIFVALAALWFIAFVALRKKGSGTPRQPLVGGILAIIMAVVVLVVGLAEVPITAPIAIPLFVGAILEFGLLIGLCSKILRGRIPQRAFVIGVFTLIAAILVGVVLMFQPVTPKLFNLGFDFVLIALLAFNFWNHITPRLRKS